jgi:hypothetical protein
MEREVPPQKQDEPKTQVDSVDSPKLKLNYSSWDDPKKATVLSAILPGAGQIYNRKWWKAGIVYGGAAGLVFMYKYNKDSMDAYQTALNARIDDDPLTVDTKYPLLSQTSVQNFRDFHRRYRDIAIVGFVGLYALQVIDANVDAHLKEFRVNEDLSMKIAPQLYAYNPTIGYYTGLKIQLNIK